MSTHTTVEKLLEKGRREGRKEGQCAMLLLLLGIRFGELPAPVVARVEAAQGREIDRWAGRVLTAQALDDVFGKG